jgi:hypothetical protein
MEWICPPTSPDGSIQVANKPNYKVVDIRKTQDTSYGKHEYVTSDLNPGIVFHGSEVEFNSMTKYFYADLSGPQKTSH